ncbi:MAG TPA: LpxL/LpxP family Kdo(2)-lipid IV(A) lauroyl/palmitoleoyl acyltransferase [Rudaea sp.]|jgi:KDO2-lipid IV(A) lauroyltransferase|nr:LpxL/LpxP family Kdo(2)-lipid IV(A) lauroyl/palmitoleoyl acyltransferase [Rudaea sp.]
MISPPFPKRLLWPKWWPTWLLLGLMWLLSRMPYRAQLGFGRFLGRFTRRLPGSRRRIARRNLELCFPEKSVDERERLLKGALADLGLMIAESGLTWMSSDRAFARVPSTIEGLEHLERCRAEGRGVLLVGAHFSHLELSSRLVSQHISITGMYRVMDNDALDWFTLHRRLTYGDGMFTKEELRATVKYLKRGGTVWYAPDQDMRGKDSVFVPFFGIQASTITATHHLARLSGAAVIPFFHKRLDDGGYALRLEAPLENFPTDDAVADTARVNTFIEQMVREAPTQYLWVHKRFKTRPPNTPSVY